MAYDHKQRWFSKFQGIGGSMDESTDYLPSDLCWVYWGDLVNQALPV